jgi:NADH-quinone oxidoreductase subunit L
LCIWLWGNKTPRVIEMFAVAFSLAAAGAACALVPLATNQPALRISVGGVFGEFTFVPDGLGVLPACIATVIGSLCVLFSLDYMRGEKQLARYYALVLLFIGAMAGLVLTSSLLLLFFFWELVAFFSYALISFHNDNPKAVAGGIKALVMTQIGGVGLALGVLLTYAQLHTYEFNALLQNSATMPREILACIAFGFLLAASAKSAQVPFHTWLPDAMEAPTPVSALIHAATMVNAGIYLLARFYPAFASVPAWTATVMIIGIVSALLAALMALTANDLKRVLAYSTISQLGYMVFAVGIGATLASQFHLLNHALFKALLFLAAGAVIHRVGTRDLVRLGGLGKRMPFVRNAFVVGALALAGVPVLNGFWSKELILEASFENAGLFVSVLMLLGVALTALYATRVTWLVFNAPPRENARVQEIGDAPRAMRIVLGVLVVATCLSWLLLGGISELFANAHAFGNGDSNFYRAADVAGVGCGRARRGRVVCARPARAHFRARSIRRARGGKLVRV